MSSEKCYFRQNQSRITLRLFEFIFEIFFFFFDTKKKQKKALNSNGTAFIIFSVFQIPEIQQRRKSGVNVLEQKKKTKKKKRNAEFAARFHVFFFSVSLLPPPRRHFTPPFFLFPPPPPYISLKLITDKKSKPFNNKRQMNYLKYLDVSSIFNARSDRLLKRFFRHVFFVVLFRLKGSYKGFAVLLFSYSIALLFPRKNHGNHSHCHKNLRSSFKSIKIIIIIIIMFYYYYYYDILII